MFLFVRIPCDPISLSTASSLVLPAGNAALEELNALLGTTGQAVDLSSASAVPSTLTSTSGPGSIACAFANGQVWARSTVLLKRVPDQNGIYNDCPVTFLQNLLRFILLVYACM